MKNIYANVSQPNNTDSKISSAQTLYRKRRWSLQCPVMATIIPVCKNAYDLCELYKECLKYMLNLILDNMYRRLNTIFLYQNISVI